MDNKELKEEIKNFNEVLIKMSSFRLNYTQERLENAFIKQGASASLAGHLVREFEKRNKDIVKFYEHCDLAVRRGLIKILLEGFK